MKTNPILLLMCMCFFITAFCQQSYTTTEVFFESDVRLSGLVFTPQHPLQPRIGVALIQGSGNSDRTNAWAYAFAEILANQGIYVLLPDKRGCGKSQGDWKSASFQMLAKDAAASAEFLWKQYSIKHLGVMGLSQGGHIAPVVPTISSHINFVIDVSGAAVTLEKQILHEVVNSSRKAGLQPSEIQEVIKLHVLMKDYVMEGKWQPLEDKFKALKNSPWHKYAATFPNQKDLWVWDWIRLNFEFDPMPYWAQLSKPVFIAYGSEDEQDNVPVWQSIYLLEKAFHDKKNALIKVYKTGHALYEDDKPAIRQEFVEDLLIWLKAAARD